MKTETIRRPARLRQISVAMLLAVLLVPGFHPDALLAAGDGDAKPSVGEYTIGPGDVLLVSVADAPEFGGRFRVSDAGAIQIAGVTKPVAAEGRTPSELSQVIRESLISAGQLRDPKVSVFVDEFHGRTVTVLGAVSKPSTYSLQKRTTVLEALSLAGGPLPNSGSTVTVVRGAASAEATGTTVGSVQIMDITRLMKEGDLSANVEVRNGDVINVSAAQVVYVVGAVVKPGGFALSNPSDGLSVAQSVALAQGLTPMASSHRGLIVRQSTAGHGRTEIPVDIARILRGEETDVTLAPNDILFVPESGRKKTLKIMGDIAMATVNGIAIYGVGYKIGTSY